MPDQTQEHGKVDQNVKLDHSENGNREANLRPYFQQMQDVAAKLRPAFAPLGMTFRPETILAVAMQESGGSRDPADSHSFDNGLGIMQITPYQGQLDGNLAKVLNWDNSKSVEYNVQHSKWRDAAANILAGGMELLNKAQAIKAILRSRGKGAVWDEMDDKHKWRATAFAYNAGQGTAASALARGGPNAPMISTFTYQGKTISHDYTKEMEAREEYVDAHDPFKGDGGGGGAPGPEPGPSPNKDGGGGGKHHHHHHHHHHEQQQRQNANGDKGSQQPAAPPPGYREAPRLDQVKAGQAFIRKGMAGESVRFVQEKVRVIVDGEFGPITMHAVMEFQRRHGLEVDGVVGMHTVIVLEGGQPPDSHGKNKDAPGKDQGGGSPQKEPPAASGGDPVAIARQYVTHPPTASIKLKGKLPHFTAAGGETNDCADFVSSVLETAGRISGHHINVGEFEHALVAQGWKYVTKAQSKPGDVWIMSGREHTELVSGAGGSSLIGSNNDRPGHQVVTETPGWSGIYLHKDFGGAPQKDEHHDHPEVKKGGEGNQHEQANKKDEPKKPEQDASAEKQVRAEVLSKARSHLGARYYWGASGPSMFDCSGFSWYVLHTDMKLTDAGRTNAQGLSGPPYTVPTGSPEEGDLVFYSGSSGISHVTIATGEGSTVIGASGGGSHTFGNDPNAKVKYTDWNNDRRSKSFGSIRKLIAHKLGNAKNA